MANEDILVSKDLKEVLDLMKQIANSVVGVKNKVDEAGNASKDAFIKVKEGAKKGTEYVEGMRSQMAKLREDAKKVTEVFGVAFVIEKVIDFFNELKSSAHEANDEFEKTTASMINFQETLKFLGKESSLPEFTKQIEDIAKVTGRVKGEIAKGFEGILKFSGGDNDIIKKLTELTKNQTIIGFKDNVSFKDAFEDIFDLFKRPERIVTKLTNELGVNPDEAASIIKNSYGGKQYDELTIAEKKNAILLIGEEILRRQGEKVAQISSEFKNDISLISQKNELQERFGKMVDSLDEKIEQIKLNIQGWILDHAELLITIGKIAVAIGAFIGTYKSIILIVEVWSKAEKVIQAIKAGQLLLQESINIATGNVVGAVAGAVAAGGAFYLMNELFGSTLDSINGIKDALPPTFLVPKKGEKLSEAGIKYNEDVAIIQTNENLIKNLKEDREKKGGNFTLEDSENLIKKTRDYELLRNIAQAEIDNFKKNGVEFFIKPKVAPVAGLNKELEKKIIETANFSKSVSTKTVNINIGNLTGVGNAKIEIVSSDQVEIANAIAGSIPDYIANFLQSVVQDSRINNN